MASSAGAAARGDRAGNDEEALGNDNPCRMRGCGVRRRDAVDGNAGVTLESAVKIVAEAVVYTFEICKDGTVVVFKGSRRGSDG